MCTFYFYLPCTDSQFSRIPRRLDQYASWQREEAELNPFLGRYHWILQTYLHLLETDLDVRLVNFLPDIGVVVGHIETFSYNLQPSPSRIIVPALVDKDIPIPHAALHVTHNPVQGFRFGGAHFYMPPWPQIGLIPRSADRGALFENLVFMGNREHLHPFMKSDFFMSHLKNLGVNLLTPEPAHWHDFSFVDSIVAIRNFGFSNAHLQRPALKLFNAWRAGVPAVLGYESAYRFVGKSGTDYLEATHESMLMDRISELALSPSLRSSIVNRGLESVAAYTDEAIRERWRLFLVDVVVPIWREWYSRGGYTPSSRLLAAIRERLLWRFPAAFTNRSPAISTGEANGVIHQ